MEALAVQSLLDLARAATAPDKRLDAEVGALLRISPVSAPWVVNWGAPYVAHPRLPGCVALSHSSGELGMHWRAEPYTASVDAVLGLIERVRPDVNCWGFDRTPLGVEAYVSRNNVPHGHWLVEAECATPPLALLAALLSSLINQPVQVAA